MANEIEQNIEGQAVNFYCKLKIKDQVIISANIIHLVIKEWIFDIVPRIEMIINDDGTLTELFPLQDGDLITIELKKNSQFDPPIQLTFDLISYTGGVMHGNKFMQLVIVGVLHVEDFYSPIRTRSFNKQNSKTALLQILNNEGKMTVNCPVQPSDNMTWLQVNISNIDFCKHILKRSYIANDTMFLYADTKGEFNYTSFKTEAEKINEGTARFNIQKWSADRFEDDADYKDFWFNNYNIFDFNSYINRIRNYGVNYNYYDTTNGGKTATLTDSTHPLTDLSTKFKDRHNQTTYTFDLGYLPIGNVHENYYKALVQNDYYKANLFGGFILELNINSISTPRLFSKVKLLLPSLLAKGENEPLSGDYIVAGIVHEIGKGIQYIKRMALMRNGFNKSKFLKVNTMYE